MIPFFDGHNDLLLKMTLGRMTAEEVRDGHGNGHIDLPRAKAGGLGGGFFALFVPTPGGPGINMAAMREERYDLPLPEPLDHDIALDQVREGIGHFNRLAELGVITPCTTATEVEAALHGPTLAAVLHMEGAEAIGPDLAELDELYDAGLRSIGPVWSRETIFGHGVPFRLPATADIGPGLTEAGKDLVRACNDRGIMVDLSHLNMAGLHDVAELSTRPLVATHSNAHAVTPSARNLTDDELRIIAGTNGLVGINYGTCFLRPDGRFIPDCPVEFILRHLDHLLGILGEDGVAFGSDFDGAILPDWMADVAGLAPLREALVQHGLGEALMEKLLFRNWLRVQRATWGA
ncbi:renal dipeptidase family protein [Pseudooceanicola batsensis HTCC2597]|uniref:Renal dipeptidase family protein n=1 Tax=Pseudooceanicola batsensis (strain ATCC BAA-863 / DSM 15984 / KCTC 12145 / HTCC2597) TaxID=252305 RepID=A3U289_PSEBH|nr:membrane dipeptidase [Pseudooceanicola batsensis]EAQ01689.1 renal dipeptidase family protein [Pseudooceanicola batsensis HTCC2597]